MDVQVSSIKLSKLKLGLYIVVVLSSLALFYFYPEVDLKLSQFIYNKLDGFLPETFPITLVSYILWGVILLFLLIVPTYMAYKYSWKILLIPILTVFIIHIIPEYAFKQQWERPRPVEVIQFGGDELFESIYEVEAGIKVPETIKSESNNSFISRHTLAAAYVVIIFGGFTPIGSFLLLLVILSRLVTGNHFISDCIFAVLLIYPLTFADMRKRINKENTE